MAKLYFRYGTMDSSKTANALMVRYNYLEKGQNPIILKPKIENRDGEKTIRSRIGISAECDYVEDLLEKAREVRVHPRDTCLILGREIMDHFNQPFRA